MKHLVRTVLLVLGIVSWASCYDRDMIDMKEFNHVLPKVKNLGYSQQANTVTLKWEIPANITPDFIRPLEVSIQKVENDIYREVIVVGNEGTSRDITIDPNKTYRFVVKLSGYLTEAAREKGKAERVYSAGEVIHVK